MRRRILIALIAVLAIGLVGCNQAEDQTEQATEETGSLLDEIVQRGTLRVGMSTFVPWAMRDKEGELIGFEIDVARRLAEDMGVEVEFVPTQWSGIIPALLTGKFDVIIGGMGILPQRNLQVNFSKPYYFTGMSIAAHKEKATGLSNLEDFNNSDVVIAARIGTTAADAAQKHMPDAEIRLFEAETQAVQELLNGNAHALVASAPLPAYLVIDNPDSLFLPLEGTFTKEPIGFALPKGDLDLLNYFNSWITVVEAEGWLEERRAYWFGTRDWADRIQ